MGNAAFYYYPQPDGGELVTIDLGSGLGQLYSDFEWQGETGVTLNGRMQRVNGMTRERVFIQRDRMINGETTANKLLAMQNHLDRGNSVIFTADTDRTFFAPVSQTPVGGDTSINVHGNPYKDIVGTNVPSGDDFVVLETQSPGMIYEVRKVVNSGTVSAANGGAFTTDAINFTYANKLAFARYYRSWVGLRRPADQVGRSIITNEYGILWSLNLELVCDQNIMFRRHPGYGSSIYTEWETEHVPPDVTFEDDNRLKLDEPIMTPFSRIFD
tara:strand:+ start:3015 stop:3827 length:813 start_codon:yes stop_codon:yes gene_type:complete